MNKINSKVNSSYCYSVVSVVYIFTDNSQTTLLDREDNLKITQYSVLLNFCHLIPFFHLMLFCFAFLNMF